jgi:hypothetical protein
MIFNVLDNALESSGEWLNPGSRGMPMIWCCCTDQAGFAAATPRSLANRANSAKAGLAVDWGFWSL